MDENYWLPLIFMAVMGLSMLIYVVLDGYDLGVGVLLRQASTAEQDLMIASIGPFWDANETWLVLGIGVLLTAFPLAHGMILGALYLPVTFMLFGLILRGVAFDFRVKAHDRHKRAWTRAFHAGSLLAAFAQGLMLGLYITGFDGRLWTWVFAAFVGLALMAGYALLGACWLIMKSEGELQAKAVRWARRSLWYTAAGVVAVSLATPWVSARIFDKWFSWPNLLFLAPVPLATAGLFLFVHRQLERLSHQTDAGSSRGEVWPLAGAVLIFVLAFAGLAYSLYPYLVVDRLDIWQAASAPDSLKFILVGVAIVLPVILFYTVYAYRVFRGKVKELSYY